VNFYTVLESARRRNEIALGYRIIAHATDAGKAYGVVTNPEKSPLVTFSPGDKSVQDNYYKDLAHLTFAERAAQNFDHPDAIDVELMASHIRTLKAGEPIRMPTYDFTHHLRRARTVRVAPKRVIIVEGILVLACEELRHLMDVRLYVDTDDDIRFIRRLKRDTLERERKMEAVIEQYLATVRPMHHEFVEKSKRWADLILPWRDLNPAAVGMMIQMVRGFLRRRIRNA
jgi:uridine kinase